MPYFMGSYRMGSYRPPWPVGPGGQEREPMTEHAFVTPALSSLVSAPDLEALAHEAQVPLAEVAQLYTRELAILTAEAQITTFLPILATRQVRALLRQRLQPRGVPAE